MHIETIDLCAYHESGRVAYAYQCGYSCESITLSETDPGAGVSKLNAGADGDSIQLILKDKLPAADTAVPSKAIDIARKLMKIYCAGSCAATFCKEEKQISAQTEIEIPRQDIKYINLIQSFLKNNVPRHPADYPTQVIAQIFRELKQKDNWNVIETLAQTVLNTEGKKIHRFYVEDALMKAGFKPEQRQQASSHQFAVKVQEDETKSEKDDVSAAQQNGEQLLEKTLKNFLRLIKKPLSEEEIEASVKYLKQVFSQYH